MRGDAKVRMARKLLGMMVNAQTGVPSSAAYQKDTDGW
jgi:hypothetical protein